MKFKTEINLVDLLERWHQEKEVVYGGTPKGLELAQTSS